MHIAGMLKAPGRFNLHVRWSCGRNCRSDSESEVSPRSHAALSMTGGLTVAEADPVATSSTAARVPVAAIYAMTRMAIERVMRHSELAFLATSPSRLAWTYFSSSGKYQMNRANLERNGAMSGQTRWRAGT